jgi:thiamine-monophosphate kinase
VNVKDKGLGEFGLIERFRRVSPSNDRIALGIGDDCASIRFTPGAEVLVTTDMLMEGRHFRTDDPLVDVGRKCLGVNLSDIAAMAGRPIASVVAVALPKARAVEAGLALHEGIAEMASRFGVALVGGDTNAWEGPLVVSITVFGEATDRGVVRRSGARPGDAVVVTGPLGGSLMGRHLRPLPRIQEALTLHERVDLHAMIDLSDGLAGDLRHILEESGGLGAILDAEAIPIHPDARAMSRLDNRSPLDHALGDGEDFELCFTVDPADADRLLASPPAGVTVYLVGTIDDGPGLRLRHPEGRVEPCGVRGFDHLSGGGA